MFHGFFILFLIIVVIFITCAKEIMQLSGFVTNRMPAGHMLMFRLLGAILRFLPPRRDTLHTRE